MALDDGDLFEFDQEDKPSTPEGEGKVIASAPAAEAPAGEATEVDLNAGPADEEEDEAGEEGEAEKAPDPATAGTFTKPGSPVPPRRFLVDEPLEYDQATKLLSLTLLPGPEKLVVIEGSSHMKPPILKSAHWNELALPGLIQAQLAALEAVLGKTASDLVTKKVMIAIMPDDGKGAGPLVSITALARPGESLGAVPARWKELQPLPQPILDILDQLKTRIGQDFQEAEKKKAERLKQEEERKARRAASPKGGKTAPAGKPAAREPVKPSSAQTDLFGQF